MPVSIINMKLSTYKLPISLVLSAWFLRRLAAGFAMMDKLYAVASTSLGPCMSLLLEMLREMLLETEVPENVSLEMVPSNRDTGLGIIAHSIWESQIIMGQYISSLLSVSLYPLSVSLDPLSVAAPVAPSRVVFVLFLHPLPSPGPSDEA